MTDQGGWQSGDPYSGSPQPADAHAGGYSGPPPTIGPGAGPGWVPPTQPYGAPPFAGQPFGGQPFAGQPFAGPPGYPVATYPAAYPVAYPMIPGYVLAPTVDPRDRRPGVVTASAVLGFISAGLLIIAALILFDGASLAHDLQSNGQHVDSELAIDAILNLLAGGLLIGGAVGVTTRSATGRIIYSIGGAIVLGETVYWLIRWHSLASFGVNFWAGVFGALTIVGLSLGWSPRSMQWFARGRQLREGTASTAQ